MPDTISTTNAMQKLSIQLKQSLLTPIYSPRTTYSQFLAQIHDLTINLVINIDKYILMLFKEEFFKNQNQLNLTQFLACGKKYLKNWQIQLQDRDQKLFCCLNNFYKYIDQNKKGAIKWQQFNSKLIQTSLNLKSLSNNIGIQAPTFKQQKNKQHFVKSDRPISKMISLNQKGKAAFFRQQAIQIQFFWTDQKQQNNNGKQTLKSIHLPQQLIKVQTMIKTKIKQNSDSKLKLKSHQNKSQNIKKDMIVSNFKNIVLDMIYLPGKKYNMLLVSCSDKIIRGWNVSANVPILAMQPENQDEPMVHQFPTQIYTMAWDDINQVLYCSGKNMKIYQWVIKTDSERQLHDPKGHTQMICSMLMLPKLQFLATGGYDGKMILWDTINHQIKCQYIEHTRSISSITFHQKLILLFTSSYDHSICIWNPYISSLIHKIDNTAPIITTALIPNTSFLIYLDLSKNVKIRQINRFTLVSSFTLMNSSQKQHNIESTTNNEEVNSLVLTGFTQNNETSQIQQIGNEAHQKQHSKKQVKLYIGGDQLYSFLYQQVDRNIFHDFSPKFLKYNPQKFHLYVPIKNNIVVWDLLTGVICNILYQMTQNQNEITSFDIIVSNKSSKSKSNFMFIGDIAGNIYQRKLQNGLFVKTLFQSKTKQSISRMNSYIGGIWNSFILFAMNDQNDLMSFARDNSQQFIHLRTINVKNDFQLQGSVNSLCFQEKRNNLIIGTTSNELLVLDVEKQKLILKIVLNLRKNSQINSLYLFPETPQVIVFSKLSQIVSFYLPPHNKKLKQSINVGQNSQFQSTITLSTISSTGNKIYGFASDNYLYCFELNLLAQEGKVTKNSKHLSKSQNHVDEVQQLKLIWRGSFVQKDKAKFITLIQNDFIIVLITTSNKIVFVSTQNGEVISYIDSKTIRQRQQQKKTSPQPIFYLKNQNNNSQIYLSKQDTFIELGPFNAEEKFKKIIDPYFFIKSLQSKNFKSFQQKNNFQWPLCPNINKNSQTYLQDILKERVKLQAYSTVKIKRQSTTLHSQMINKALEIQKKWEKDKEENQISTKKALRNSSSNNLKFTLTRGSSFNLLKGSKSVYKNEILKLQRLSPSHQNLKNNPMYRLGQALKSLDIEDKKAQRFIQIAEKRQFFPKIKKQ